MKLQCKDLKKSFDGITAVDGVTVSFEPGQVTALVGPNGAGKTTLFHLITGFLQPDSGEIRIGKRPIQGLPPWKIASLGIGRLFQDVRVFDRLPVLDNVLAAFPNQIGENPLWAILRRKHVSRAEESLKIQAFELLKFVGLENETQKLAEELSYGQQKLLAIARLLANNANILLLDEPTAGVNPQMVDRLLDLIRRLARERHKTVVIIEHNMNVVLNVADWLYFMDDGKIEAHGLPEDVLANEEVKQAYIGLE